MPFKMHLIIFKKNVCLPYLKFYFLMLPETHLFFIWPHLLSHRDRSGSVVECLIQDNPSLELVQPRKTRPFITERLLMGRKESNQTNKAAVTCCFCAFPSIGALSMLFLSQLSLLAIYFVDLGRCIFLKNTDIYQFFRMALTFCQLLSSAYNPGK